MHPLRRTDRRRARYAVEVRTGLGANEAWARILDPARHAAVVPLTTLRERDGRGALVLGERFVMQSTLGPLTLDDAMVVDRLRGGPAGGAVRFVKTGRVLRGVVLARVRSDRPAGMNSDRSRTSPARTRRGTSLPGGAVVRWDAELEVRGLPRILDPVVAVAAHLAYGMALRRLLVSRVDGR